MPSVHDLVRDVLGLRQAEPIDDDTAAVLVAREDLLLAELVRQPSASIIELAAKANMATILALAGDCTESLVPELMRSARQDAERLQKSYDAAVLAAGKAA